MTRIGIIIGSTRPNRIGPVVAQWVYDEAIKRDDAEFELLDVESFKLPLLDEPKPAASGEYTHEHTRKWSEAIARCDGFIFVTPEYNHGMPAALKNALDYLWPEWNNKACGFVSYGSVGGSRSVEQFRQVAAQLLMADVRAQVMFTFGHEFDDDRNLKPTEASYKSLAATITQVLDWTNALAPLRAK
ncbi:MAG: NAD(P)H-dependent oxidoreductase [Candidatus Nanopelagicales bacterium]